MQVTVVDWIVGGRTSDFSSSLQVSGVKTASLQVVGPVTSAAYLEGSVDGVHWEVLCRVEVYGQGPSQIGATGLRPVSHFRVAIADDAGSAVSVSAVLSG